jgi:hypothetical protein
VPCDDRLLFGALVPSPYLCYVGLGNATGNNHLKRALMIEDEAKTGTYLRKGLQENGCAPSLVTNPFLVAVFQPRSSVRLNIYG